MSHGLQQHEGSYATHGNSVQVHQKVTVKVIFHDLMVRLWPNGAGGRHIRRNLWIRFLKIYRQSSINGPNVGGLVEFEFKRRYKLQVAIQQKTLGNLKISCHAIRCVWTVQILRL